MKVILDTSTLIASFARSSPFRPIYSALLEGKYELAISTEIILEYSEKIEEKTNPIISENLIELITTLPNTTLQKIYYSWQLIEKDPDDNKFVDCYVASGADYLVSNDKHFRVLDPDGFPPVKMISIEAFLEIVEAL